ncbi:acyl-CoA/acyl-ACP dehydrogenase [Natronomonas gomsonensis]|uniref:acyl-CoA dehydrogenase family protein n=1 Tax=Natronomonas gomsonensis TaxID=1046043 RepID=UPI0020CA3E0C|nr:acyl-CoA dehydrogenase family protein [Natronomonas gomsonensis]MCY4731359.1 acyl-CoA/acyl-ACP dehydrogenase [Natronomonas gomsonensis]
MYYDDDGGEFRENLRAHLEEHIEPIVDEADREPLTREEFLEYTGVLRELDIGFEPGVAEEYFGNLERFTIVSEEVSRVWPSLNVALQMSFPSVFVQHAADVTQDAMLDKLHDGECIGCLAVTEPEGGSDTARPNTVAYKDGDEYVLEGKKQWVGNAPIADVALVVAHDDEADTQDMFLVDQANSPFETETMDKLGWKGVNNGKMYFDDVRIPEDNRLSNIVGNALMDGADMQEIVPFPESVSQLFFEQKALNATFSFMRTGMSFMAVGIMQAAFEEALEYAEERETFGDPIGSTQLVQEKLYEILRDLETSRHLSRHALELLKRGDDRARLISSLAKAYTAERSVDATYNALQIHGGEGLKTENRLERYYRDASVMTIPDGTTEIQKLIVGKELTGMSAY